VLKMRASEQEQCFWHRTMLRFVPTCIQKYRQNRFPLKCLAIFWITIFVLFKSKGIKHFLKGTDVFRQLSPTCGRRFYQVKELLPVCNFEETLVGRDTMSYPTKFRRWSFFFHLVFGRATKALLHLCCNCEDIGNYTHTPPALTCDCTHW